MNMSSIRYSLQNSGFFLMNRNSLEISTGVTSPLSRRDAGTLHLLGYICSHFISILYYDYCIYLLITVYIGLL